MRQSAIRNPQLEEGPHRLEAKDTGLSRRQHGFDSRWGRQYYYGEP